MREVNPKETSRAYAFEMWMKAFTDCGIDPDFYLRARGLEETLPWDHIDVGVKKSFLKKEYERAMKEETTPNCREKCSGCGANSLGGERSCCPNAN